MADSVQTEPQAALEHERLASLINSMSDGVIALDKNLKIVIYNGAALNILDTNGTIKGKAISRVVHPMDNNNQPKDIAQLIRSTTSSLMSRDYYLLQGDGDKVALFLSVTPVHGGYGSQGVQGYVLIMRDITHEKSLEEERDEFISVVSHELRTPITIAEGSVSNAMYAAQRNNKPELVVEALQTAHEQILFLADMINDLSTLSRAERGVLTVDREPINIHNLLQELTESYREEAAAKSLEIHTVLDPKLETLTSGKLYVEEILQNLITNSIKYTDKGSITIEAKPVATGVQITISDTGIGISKHDQEKIFDKFFRSEDYRTRQNKGTGLGLYVTMKLLRLLHAEITVDSELNKGSHFTVTFPNL